MSMSKEVRPTRRKLALLAGGTAVAALALPLAAEAQGYLGDEYLPDYTDYYDDQEFLFDDFLF